MTDKELLAVRLERLRTILAELEVVRPGSRHEQLLDRARLAIADVRQAREMVVRQRPRQKTTSAGFVLDYRSSSDTVVH